MKQLNSLCSILWTGFSNEPDGRAQPCCLYKGYIEEKGEVMYVQNHSPLEILNSQYMKDLRERFRNNEKPKECSVCWTDEANGYQSKRITYNNLIRTDKIDYNKEPVSVSELQLIINNSCNLKCRSCTPSHSTQWQQEIKILTGKTAYPMPHGQSGDENGKLWTERFEWYKGLRRLEIVGGEPFYVKQWHLILNELIDLGYSKNIDVVLSTNCTLFFPELLSSMAQNFKCVSIDLSIDGIESTYEYLRHPGKWSVVYSNMKKYYPYVDKVKIQVTITISWLNALQLTEIHELLLNEFPKFDIWNNIVHNPQHMAIWACPKLLKEEISRQWNNYSWLPKYRDSIQSILNYMNSQNIDYITFKNNLSLLYKTDEFRKEQIVNSIPELSKYI